MIIPKPSPMFGSWRTRVVRAPRGRKAVPTTEIARLAKQLHEEKDSNRHDHYDLY